MVSLYHVKKMVVTGGLYYCFTHIRDTRGTHKDFTFGEASAKSESNTFDDVHSYQVWKTIGVPKNGCFILEHPI